MIKILVVGVSLLCMAALAVASDQKEEIPLKDLPDLQSGGFKVDPYISAAIKLQALGKQKACDALSQLAADREHDNQAIVLCRMLFTKKAKEEIRRPMIGAASFFGGTDYADWPLEPIEIVDGLPLLITRGYSLHGKAEPADSYLKYCIEHCDWNTETLKPKTVKEKQTALDKLISSPKWKTPLDDREKGFLSAQIK